MARLTGVVIKLPAWSDQEVGYIRQDDATEAGALPFLANDARMMPANLRFAMAVTFEYGWREWLGVCAVDVRAVDPALAFPWGTAN